MDYCITVRGKDGLLIGYWNRGGDPSGDVAAVETYVTKEPVYFENRQETEEEIRNCETQKIVWDWECKFDIGMRL